MWGEVTGKGKEARGYELAKILEKRGDEFESLGGVVKELNGIIDKKKGGVISKMVLILLF